VRRGFNPTNFLIKKLAMTKRVLKRLEWIEDYCGLDEPDAKNPSLAYDYCHRFEQRFFIRRDGTWSCDQLRKDIARLKRMPYREERI
jgi:hypothetical protein